MNRIDPIPLPALAALQATPLVIRADPAGGFLAYLDFSEVFEPSLATPGKTFRRLSPRAMDESFSFSGWIGFFGYEFLATHLGLNLRASRDVDVPPGWFARPQTIIHLHADKTLIESTVPDRAKDLASSLAYFTAQREANRETGDKIITCNLSFEQYEGIFSRAREAILDGETYQIKISQRFESSNGIDPLLSFDRLCTANPAPEAFLLHTEEFSIISCSPEVVIDRKGNEIVTRPIGGTYERDKLLSDESAIERFLRDPKEIAEHNMLVDLERNDLSTVCIPGSVTIDRFREVESYAHLHHLVSTIRGTLREGTDLPSLLQAMLPGGSITGCPKIRTMEWIDRLEPCFRGPYTGSFGIISDDGDLRLNLIIRSMLVTGGRCYAQAGGGIVVDSTPGYEYNENKIKAQALLDLLA
mgnify:FL=1|tara:strand:+ start:216 stop:1460 length:1245 start_codon:yes stop_codon:yes gene_type:complete